MSKPEQQAKLAKEAALKLATIETKIKNKALIAIADAIEKNKEKILDANKKDVSEAEIANIGQAMLKRLKLDDVKIKEITSSVRDVSKLNDPVGKTLSAIELDKGFELYQLTCPIGVIGAIFESRPDALVQISTLCLKSGNAVILKGGSEAMNSNRILAEIITNAAEKNGIPKGAIQLIETREEVKEILKLDQYIDLLVPRGSNDMVRQIMDNTKIPVLGHADGICHVYIDKDADISKAVNISFDAKCQYPAVCNAMETLLVHKEIAGKFLPIIIKKYLDSNVELRVDDNILLMFKNDKKIYGKLKKADDTDWKTEYNDLILSIKIVNNVEGAINHINEYGSKHTESIATENKETAKKFMQFVDSSSVMWNASTRFADGYRYGKGAEIGISTSKIHARGPVGLEGLVIYKYILIGNGNIVADYSGKDAKKFTHKKLSKGLKI